MLNNLDPKRKKVILIIAFVIIIAIIIYLGYKFLFKKQDGATLRTGGAEDTEDGAGNSNPRQGAIKLGEEGRNNSSPRQGAVKAGEGKSTDKPTLPPGSNTPNPFKNKIGKIAVAKSSVNVYSTPVPSSPNDNLNTYIYTASLNERIGTIQEVFKQNGLWVKIKLSAPKKTKFVKNLVRAGATGSSTTPPYSGNADCMQKVKEQAAEFGKNFDYISEAECDNQYGYVMYGQISVLNII